MRPEDRRAIGAMTTEEAQSAYDARSEKELQDQCERWLPLHGFARLTADNAVAPPANLAGWFGHEPRAVGQAFLPDLFIFEQTMRHCLMVELKKPEGAIHWQPGQRESVESGRWTLCRSFGQFTAAVTGWMAEKTHALPVVVASDALSSTTLPQTAPPPRIAS